MGERDCIRLARVCLAAAASSMHALGAAGVGRVVPLQAPAPRPVRRCTERPGTAAAAGAAGVVVAPEDPLLASFLAAALGAALAFTGLASVASATAVVDLAAAATGMRSNRTKG